MSEDGLQSVGPGSRLWRALLEDRHDVLADGQKSCRTLWIELLATLLLDLGKGDLGGHSFAVRSVRGHGIKGIRHRDNAGEVGNGLTRQSVRIALAVPALVVGAGDGDHRSQIRNR